MIDVFVSYASEDRARIMPLVRLLENEGWTVWWDRTMHAGPSYSAEIQRALDDASCVVVLWSTHSIESNWCREEAQEGLDRGVLVPALIDEVRMPLGFRSMQTASLAGWPEERGEIGALLSGVRSCLATDPSSEPLGDSAAADVPSIAVLPFANLSSDPDQEFFCDGLADDLIDILVRGSKLRIIARTSSNQFKGAARDARDIGDLLGVTHILEGSVRRAGDQIRVAAQLVHCGDGSTEWSERYDRQLKDIFTLQEDIAQTVARALNARFSEGHDRETYNAEAHILVLQAKHLLDLGGEPSVVIRARDLLEQAKELEPRSPAVWTGLHRAYQQIGTLLTHQDRNSDPLLRDFTLEQVDRRAADASREALNIDPADPRANVIRGWNAFFRGHKALAADRFRLVIGSDPTHLELLHGLVRPLIWALRANDAVVVSRYLLRIDPLNVIAISNLAVALFCDEEFEECMEQINRALALNPNERYATWLLGILHLEAGAPERALELADNLTAGSIDRAAMRVMALHGLERFDEADEVFAQLQRDFPESLYEVAGVHACLGQPDEAFGCLEQAVARESSSDRFGPMNTLIDSRWVVYHGDARWTSFLEHTRQTGEDLVAFDVDVSYLG